MNALYGHTRYRMAMVLWAYLTKLLVLCIAEPVKTLTARPRMTIALVFIPVAKGITGVAILGILVGAIVQRTWPMP